MSTFARLYPYDQGRRTEDLPMLREVLAREEARSVLEIGVGNWRVARGLFPEGGDVPFWVGVENDLSFADWPSEGRWQHWLKDALLLRAAELPLSGPARPSVILIPFSTLTLFAHANQHNLLSNLAREFPGVPVYAEVFLPVLPEGHHRLQRGPVEIEGERLQREDELLVEPVFQRTRALRTYRGPGRRIVHQFEELIYWRTPLQWIDLFGAHFQEVSLFRPGEMEVPQNSILLRGVAR